MKRRHSLAPTASASLMARPALAQVTTPVSGTSTDADKLKWDVFVTPGIPIVSSNFPPSEKHGMWSPTSSTLIYGKQDAVLVDTFDLWIMSPATDATQPDESQTL